MWSGAGKYRLDLEDFKTSKNVGIHVGSAGMVRVGFMW